MPLVDARKLGPIAANVTRRQAGDASIRILVAIGHPVMRALTCELLARERGYRVAGVAGEDRLLAEGIDQSRPDLVVLDTFDFPGRFPTALRLFPPERVIVVGPEPDGWYRDAALAAGAGGWVSRDRLGDDLADEVCRVVSGVAPCFAAHPGRAARVVGAGQ
jgi:DNA-binding NarL/FixJ family response regulator